LLFLDHYLALLPLKKNFLTFFLPPPFYLFFRLATMLFGHRLFSPPYRSSIFGRWFGRFSFFFFASQYRLGTFGLSFFLPVSTTRNPSTPGFHPTPYSPNTGRNPFRPIFSCQMNRGRVPPPQFLKWCSGVLLSYLSCGLLLGSLLSWHSPKPAFPFVTVAFLCFRVLHPTSRPPPFCRVWLPPPPGFRTL